MLEVVVEVVLVGFVVRCSRTGERMSSLKLVSGGGDGSRRRVRRCCRAPETGMGNLNEADVKLMKRQELSLAGYRPYGVAERW